MKQFGNHPFYPPPISEQYFHDSPLCPNFKNGTPLILGGRKLWYYILCKLTYQQIEQILNKNKLNRPIN